MVVTIKHFKDYTFAIELYWERIEGESEQGIDFFCKLKMVGGYWLNSQM
jgi:hypothetical protein